MFDLLELPKNKEVWDHFCSLLPTLKEMERYRYVRFAPLQKKHFALPSIPDFSKEDSCNDTLFFINGHYAYFSSDKMSSRLVALSLTEAKKNYDYFLKERSSLLKEESDPFTFLNHACYGEALFLYIPPQGLNKVSLKVNYLLDLSMKLPLLISPRIHLMVGKGVSFDLIINHSAISFPIWTNSFLDVTIERDGQFNLIVLSDQSDEQCNFFNCRASVKEGAILNVQSFTNGANLSWESYLVDLIGERAEANLFGGWSINKTKQHHAHVTVNHYRPHCRSLQKFKAKLYDHALTSFTGKILVKPEAQKTEAYQLNNNLILSREATANSRPNLEIFADDVKASHGSTTSYPDAKELFYLTSRGIPAEQALRLIANGFLKELIEAISHRDCRESAYRIIQ